MQSNNAARVSARRYLADTALWPWQEEALLAWNSAGHRGIVEAVTGAGKTRVALVAIARVLAIGGRVLILVPTGELLRQWALQLESAMPEARVRRMGMGATARPDADVIVAIVNSAAYRAADRWFEEWLAFKPSLLVADECHRYATPTFSTALDHAFDLRLGLTATLARPDRGEEEYLLPYFGPVAFRLDYRRALADEVVTPWEIVRIGVDLGPREAAMYSRLRKEQQDAARQLEAAWGIARSEPGFLDRVARAAQSRTRSASRRIAISYMAAFSKQRQVTGMSAAKYDAFAKALTFLENDRSALVFTATQEAAREAEKKTIAARLSATVVHSGIARSARADAIADFEDGEVQMLLAPRILDEGVDVPDCGVAFILGMGSSPRQLKQRLGRIIRRAPRKTLATLFYIYAVGTHEDLSGDGAIQQWVEAEENALRVRDLSLEQLRSIGGNHDGAP